MTKKCLWGSNQGVAALGDLFPSHSQYLPPAPLSLPNLSLRLSLSLSLNLLFLVYVSLNYSFSSSPSRIRAPDKLTSVSTSLPLQLCVMEAEPRLNILELTRYKRAGEERNIQGIAAKGLMKVCVKFGEIKKKITSPRDPRPSGKTRGRGQVFPEKSLKSVLPDSLLREG